VVVYLVTTLLQFSTECSGEKILKIGQHLATIWTKVCGLLFEPPCMQLCIIGLWFAIAAFHDETIRIIVNYQQLILTRYNVWCRCGYKIYTARWWL